MNYFFFDAMTINFDSQYVLFTVPNEKIDGQISLREEGKA